jgi:translation initiation factor 2 subunit 2
MPPPQLLRVGTRKTMWANFAQICQLMHRQPEHVMSFLLAELGQEGSIDGSSRLVIKGRYQQKQVESLLKKYIGM